MENKILSSGTRKLMIFGGILLLLGAIGWGLQLGGGLIAGSGMTNIFLWGLMIAVFAFMVGFGAGAQFVCTAIYLRGKDEHKPFAQTAAVVAFACVAAAGVAILADLGAIRNILAMVLGLNLRSPLAWDMIAMTAFLVFSIIQLFAMAKGLSNVKIWTILAGVAALALQVVEGLLFSTQAAHAWWATPIMPVDFIAVAFVSGSALLLFIAVVKNESLGIISWLARFCSIAICVHLVLALGDLALVAFSNNPVEGGVRAALLANLPLYLCELVLPAIAMVVLFIGRNSENKNGYLLASIFTIVGIFAHRMMLLFPAYNAPSLYLNLSGTNSLTGSYPISTGRYLDWGQTFANTTNYMPAPAEWLAALLPIGVAIIAAIVITLVVEILQKRQAQ